VYIKLLKKIFYLNCWRFSFINLDNPYSDLHLSDWINIPSSFLYAADPFKPNNIFIFEGITFTNPLGKIFRYDNGHISEVIFDSYLSKLHMSFPYLFEYNEEIFLLPQISGLNKLSLFRYDVEKNRAFHFKDLLLGADCRDSIIIPSEDNFIIATTMKLASGPSTFKLVLFDKNFLFIKYLETNHDNIRFRCAGYPFYYNSKLLIPIQNSFPRYGSGVDLYEVSLNGGNERISLDFVKSISLKADDIQINGFHTFNFDGSNVVLDFRFSKFNIFATIIKIIMWSKRYEFSRISYKNILGFLLLMCSNFYFKIPLWHLRSLLIYPKYYATLINLINSHNFNSILDLGAGLGELSKLRKFDNYLGIDNDCSLVRAARMLNRNVKCKMVNENLGYFDAATLLNFMHNLSKTEVVELISSIEFVRYIILDEIHRDAIEYLNHHDYCNILSGYYELEERFHVFGDKRDLLLFKKIEVNEV